MIFIGWFIWLLLAIWLCQLSHKPFHMFDTSFDMKIAQYGTLIHFAAVVHFNPWSYA